MVRLNNSGTIKMSFIITDKGDWNHGISDASYITGKNLVITKLGDVEYIFSHPELLEIIKIHNEIDIKNISLIKDATVNTGLVNKPEITFREKVFNLLNIKKKNDCENNVEYWM